MKDKLFSFFFGRGGGAKCHNIVIFYQEDHNCKKINNLFCSLVSVEREPLKDWMSPSQMYKAKWLREGIRKIGF